nr:zinc finger BED domain-containing protein RICESLEEPER 1-like [Arachis hypogaea]
MHESILKIRNAVRHVRASPGRTERFKTRIKEARILEKGTVHLDVPTRWNSTFLMLESALKFQKPFKRLGERDSEYAMMAGGIPKSEDWENARHFVKFLKIFYEHWMGSLDTVLSGMAEKMKSKYDKYWGNIKNTNMMIFIAVVLDPRYKLQLIKWSFEKLYEKEDAEFLTSKVKDTLFKVFDSYRLFGGNYQRSTRQDPPEISTHKLEAHKTSFAMEFEKKMQFNESANKNEIARDVLAMPVFTIASESAFSTGGRVLNNYRSSLTPMTTEALICTQNWLRNSPKLVLEELIEELEKLELEVAPTPDPNEEDSGVECD